MTLKFPLGQSDFRALRASGAFYADKTALLRDILATEDTVVLFLRPRRFGKTLNLSTIRWFLERSGEDLANAFEGLCVWGDETARRHYQRYPVINLSFKDSKVSTREDLEQSLLRVLVDEFRRHPELETSDALSTYERADYARFAAGEAKRTDMATALLSLSRLLHRHHGERAVILIDEYDVPIHGAVLHGFAEQALEFFRNFLSAGLKDNPHLFKGVMTGVLRIAKESLFSGLNNLSIYGPTRTEFGTEFGFTVDDVRFLLEGAGRPELYDAIAEWYDGYISGAARIFNPWSVMSYMRSTDKVLRPYWVATGSEDLLRLLLVQRGLGFRDELAALLEGGTVEVTIDESVALRDLESNAETLWSFLLYSGYLTAEGIDYEPTGRIRAAVRIPNREVRGTYLSIFSRWLGDRLGNEQAADEMIRSMLAGDAELFERRLSELVLSMISYHDTGGRDSERTYHAFLLGLLARLEGQFDVRSERETGMGRADILVLPKRPGQPGVALELKRLRAAESLETVLEAALEQLESRDYGAELRARGAVPLSTFAVVFDGKRVGVRKAPLDTRTTSFWT